MEEEAKKCSFVLVGNIPSELKSADLRAFFSHLVEKGGFACFHYRHRPEHAQPPEQSESGDILGTPREEAVDDSEGGERTNAGECGVPRRSTDAAPVSVASRCCVAAVKRAQEREFLRRYAGRHWARLGGELLRRKIKLSRVSVAFDQAEKGSETVETTGNLKGRIPWSDLHAMLELNPPSVMPYGNIGTPTSVFIDLIRQCKLPGRVIKKLNLEFPRTRSRRRYGAVGLDYGYGEVVEGGSEEPEEEEEMMVEGGKREEESGEAQEVEDPIPSVGLIIITQREVTVHDVLCMQDDDHDAEEWERYEALHDDVDKQVITIYIAYIKLVLALCTCMCACV